MTLKRLGARPRGSYRSFIVNHRSMWGQYAKTYNEARGTSATGLTGRGVKGALTFSRIIS